MIGRPPPLPDFLRYLLDVLEHSGTMQTPISYDYRLGRAREALAHRINRERRATGAPVAAPVLHELFDHAAGGTGRECRLVPQVAVDAMIRRLKVEIATARLVA